jgi:hypothetical protein
MATKKQANAEAGQTAENTQMTEAEMERESRDTGAALAEEKESIKLYQTPQGSSDAPLSDEVVIINGYRYQIQRGVDVEVPKQVAQVLRDAGRL